MGCYASSLFYYMDCCYTLPGGPRGPRPTIWRNFYNRFPQFEPCREQFSALGFSSSDLSYLKEMFDKADADGSGEISLFEMLQFLDIERTKFSKRVFAIFDEDLSGEIDFREFAVAMWNYCTLGKSALCLFAFDLYDSDSSGYIETHEVERMMRDIYGKKMENNALAQKVLRQLEGASGAQRAEDGEEVEISVAQFEKFSRTHPAMLYPAYTFQWNLQRKVLGPGFWRKKAKARLLLTGNKQTNVIEFLKAMMNEHAFQALVVDPFDKSKGGQATQQEVQNLASMMDNAGSVAARRMQKGIMVKKAVNVVQAANRLSMRGKKGRKRGQGDLQELEQDKKENRDAARKQRGTAARAKAEEDKAQRALSRFGNTMGLSAEEAQAKLQGSAARQREPKKVRKKVKKVTTATSAVKRMTGGSRVAPKG